MSSEAIRIVHTVAPPAEERTLVIRPTTGWSAPRLGELWASRELLYFLTWRDIKVRYKQTALGAAWALLQPLFTMIVFSVLFGRLGKMPSDGLPYPVFTMCGLVLWRLFADSLGASSNSLVANERLVTKVYFPRLVIPLAAVGTGLVDFLIALLILVTMMGYYGIAPGRAVLFAPVFMVMAVGTSLGVGLWLSAINVRYRDVRHTVSFLVQIWMFLTPVVYPMSLIPRRWQFLYALNPMAGAVEGWRWAVLGKTDPPGASLAVSGAVIALVLAGGLFYFRRMEKTFADLV